MATINIRDDANDGPINCIIFGNNDAAIEREEQEPNTINIYDEHSRMVRIKKSDVPFLIKALDKAKELDWLY